MVAGYDRETLRAELSRDEGRQKFPYVDRVGKTTIGIGRDLDDKGLSDPEIDFCLDNDIEEAEREWRFPLLDREWMKATGQGDAARAAAVEELRQ